VLTITKTAVRMAIRVQPRSGRDRILGPHAGVLKLQVCAPPVDGAANQAVIDLLATWLAVPRRALAIVQGKSGRDKLVEVASDDPCGLARRIESAAAACVDKPWGAD
jgi:uncharacterized protein (TIGR00251 family)